MISEDKSIKDYYIWNSGSPRPATVFDADLCSRAAVETCNIPNKEGCRTALPNYTRVRLIGEKFFVRGVNACFCEIEVKTEDNSQESRYYTIEWNLIPGSPNHP